MILLDTNVLSELMRPEPDLRVTEWFARHPAGRLFTTSITQAEILHGILQLPVGRRRDALQEAAEAMFAEDFQGRILSFTPQAAAHYARFAVARRRAGRPVAAFDAQIVAIAHCRGAAVATRNIADFELSGLQLLNPWEQ